jgi:hypothetical protein
MTIYTCGISSKKKGEKLVPLNKKNTKICIEANFAHEPNLKI